MRAFSIHTHEYQYRANLDIFGFTSKVDEDTYHGPPDGRIRLSCSKADGSDRHGLAIYSKRYYSLLAFSVVGSYHSKATLATLVSQNSTMARYGMACILL